MLSLRLNKLLLNPNPPKWWKTLRFLLNWITIPLKLLLIGGLGLYQIIYHKLFTEKRNPVPEHWVIDVDELMKNLPVYDNGHLKCYVNRTLVSQPITGNNHNTDHQCSRHGTYAFIMNKLGVERDASIDKGVYSHIQGKYLCRGYTTDGLYNARTTSGDMLCGLNLAMLDTKNDVLKDRYDLLIKGIIENDYSLLEGARPADDETELCAIYDKALIEAGMRPEHVKMKSARGMWQPSVENVGAQALTLLASLRIGDVKLGNLDARREYKNMLWKHGLGLLSIFPTAYIDSRRGYFNDHNCLVSLYVLSKLSTNKWGKLFWKIPMIYVWMLSKHWYNGYFTGLLFDAHPELLKKRKNYEYLQECMSYLQEPSISDVIKRPVNYKTEFLTNEVPVSLKTIREDEFYPDMGHNIISSETDGNTEYYRTGLGYLASVTMVITALRHVMTRDK